MAEQQGKGNGSERIRDRIGDAKAPQKKKIKIKKQPAAGPAGKTISDTFSREAAPRPQAPRGPRPPGAGPGGPSSGGGGGGQAARPPRPAGEAPRPQRGDGFGPGRGPGGPPSRGPRPGGPGEGAGGPRRGGPSPTGRPPGPAFQGAGTPFDAAIESGRRQPGGAPARGRGAGGPGGRGPGGPGGPGGGPGGFGGGGYRGGPGGGRRRSTDRERESQQKFFSQASAKRKQPTAKGTTVPSEIEIMESIQVGELAKKLNLRPGEVISRLMKLGEMVTINKVLDAETASLVAAEYGCEVKVVSLYDETVIEEESDQEAARIIRPPVVTIMGHVDHGKTKLLDTIRKSNIIDTESGAITQHIGAYQVATPRGRITFLDTPGHEAFTAMRARGASVTDIVVLVVAADDGVKEQTVEAISHAKEAEVPIIVAVNKVDLPTANVERVKQELARYELQSEDWGGKTIFCEISAKQNIGIDNLLDMILLQAELMDLRANASLRAVGTVVEARVDAGKGPVATILVQKGTLKEGDPYVVGIFSGRVRAMFDDHEHRIQEAGPATPVEITGISGVPLAGDPFQVVESEKYGREVAAKRQHYQQITDAAAVAPAALTDLKDWIDRGEVRELRIIIKADVQGSVEAIREGLKKLSTSDIRVKVIHGAAGAISESDVDLAKASDAIIVGFHVRPSPRAQELATQHRVDIRFYSVIYSCIEDIRAAMEGMLEPETVEEITGRVEVREIFKISRVGNVAGCMVTSGKIKRGQGVRVQRGTALIHTGTVKGLRRHKDDVAEVAEGFECGVFIDNYSALEKGDVLEVFDTKKIARKLEQRP